MTVEQAQAAELDGFESIVSDMLEEWQTPGAAITVVRGDEVVLRRGFGFRDLERKLPVTENTLFPLASVTKSFTATAMATLIDQGIIGWDTPVRELVPEFRLFDRVLSDRVTPRDLLSHVTGIPRHDAMWSNRDISREQLFRLLRFLEPNADLRTTYQYSNLMYMAAGYVIGALTASTWEDVVRERLFVPLGMTASNFSIAESQHLPDCAVAHARRDGSVARIPYYERQGAIGPCGAIVSNISEMAGWIALHLGDGCFGNEQLVSVEQMRELRRPHLLYRQRGRYPEMPNSNSGYGLGWDVANYRGHAMANHGGGIDGFSTYVALIPDLRLGVVILTNLAAAPAVTRSLAWNVFDRLLHVDPAPWSTRFREQQREDEAASGLARKFSAERRVPDTSPSHRLDQYAGEYTHPAYGSLVLAHGDQGLTGTYNDRDFELEHYHYDIFRLSGESAYATFTTGLNGDVAGVSIPFEPTAGPIVFERVYPRMEDPAVLRNLVGRYTRPSGTTLVIRPSGDGRLRAQVPAFDEREVVLRPVGTLEFAMEGLDYSSFGVSFTADPSGTAYEAICRVWDAAYVYTRQ